MSNSTCFIYLLLVIAVGFFVHQITVNDYSQPMEYFEPFSQDIPLKREFPAETLIYLKYFQFSPEYIKIPINSTVTWINLDSPQYTHQIRSSTMLFESPELQSNQKYSQYFDKMGVYHYFDTKYPKMTGTIEIVAERTV
jgi:hypothetical protein